MKNSNCLRWSVVLLACFVCAGYWYAPATYAQENSASQIDFGFGSAMQGTSTGVSGEIPGVSNGQRVTDTPTHSGGFRLGYTYFFNKVAGVDAGLEAARYTQNYSGDIGSTSVQSTLREIASDFVFRIPDHTNRIHPYLLVGVGAMDFIPTDNANNAAGADSQFRSALTYGGGADFDISKRIGIRAEYRGATFKAPGFNVPELERNVETHISQPLIGVYFKFSGIGTVSKGN